MGSSSNSSSTRCCCGRSEGEHGEVSPEWDGPAVDVAASALSPGGDGGVRSHKKKSWQPYREQKLERNGSHNQWTMFCKRQRDALPGTSRYRRGGRGNGAAEWRGGDRKLRQEQGPVQCLAVAGATKTRPPAPASCFLFWGFHRQPLAVQIKFNDVLQGVTHPPLSCLRKGLGNTHP